MLRTIFRRISTSSVLKGQAQNRIYAQLLEESSERSLKQLIEKVESRQYALDIEGARIYVEALNKLGLGEQALKMLAKQYTPKKPSLLQQNLQFPVAKQELSSLKLSDGLVGTKEQPLHIISKNAAPTNTERMTTLLKYGLVFYIVLAVYTTFTDEIGKVIGTSSRTSALFNEFDPNSPLNRDKVTKFADVQGVDEAKEELMEIVEFLRDPSKFTRLGGKLPKGVLLTGPAGTGKTMLARAIAGEASVPFLFTSGSEFDEIYVGTGAARVRGLFAAARKKNGPCIIFIDEIDAVGGKRNVKDQAFMRQTLNQLLVQMDGFDPTSGVIVIAATNFPENLDKALTRPGRFDRTIQIDAPDVDGRLAILKVHSKKVPMAKTVDLKIIARGTMGFTGAELANLINFAAVRAASLNQPSVTLDDLDWARDRILMGSERKSKKIAEKDRKLVAYHEGGHAIVSLYTEGSMPLHKATIVPRGDSLGMVLQLPLNDDLNWSRAQYKGRMDVCMGGRVAEEIIYGPENITSGASSDIHQATKIARSMVVRLGMGINTGPVDLMSSDGSYENLAPETRLQVDKDVKELLEDAYHRAKVLLTKRKLEHERLAQALLLYETLSKDEIDKVVKGLPLDRKPL